jgi:hypothetical protein
MYVNLATLCCTWWPQAMLSVHFLKEYSLLLCYWYRCKLSHVFSVLVRRKKISDILKRFTYHAHHPWQSMCVCCRGKYVFVCMCICVHISVCGVCLRRRAKRMAEQKGDEQWLQHHSDLVLMLDILLTDSEISGLISKIVISIVIKKIF